MLKIASLIQYTLPGVPSLYYGDETGMQGLKDPFNRGCMNWENPNEDLLRWYKRLGEIRKGCKVFAYGEFIPVYCSYKTIAYKRADESSEVLVAVNMDENPVDLEIGAEWDNSYQLLGNSSSNGILYLEPYRYSMLTINK